MNNKPLTASCLYHSLQSLSEILKEDGTLKQRYSDLEVIDALVSKEESKESNFWIQARKNFWDFVNKQY